MANPEHLEILKQGVEVWNRWREENPEIRINLIKANLPAANLSGMNLIGVHLVEGNLHNATLRGANLIGANLLNANLRQVDLRGSHLAGTNLIGADLTLANFGDAIVVYTGFGNVDLSNVRGLETVKHRGPSEIGTHTLQRSKGKIPEAFLRGCGLSDWQIENAKLYLPNLTSEDFTNITYTLHKLLVDNPVQYYSCFISYSSQDEAFAQCLYADLQQKGVRCWFALEDMKIGDKIRSRIDSSIKLHDKLLLMLSENSLNSVWVESEVEKAFEEERKRKQMVLFPVRLDDAVMETDQPWAAEIRRTRHIGDFSRWKDHDAYQPAFERLLRDLKAEG